MNKDLIVNILLGRKEARLNLDKVLPGTTIDVLRRHGLHDEADHVAMQAIARHPASRPVDGQEATVGIFRSFWCGRCQTWVDVDYGEEMGFSKFQHIRNVHTEVS